MIRKTGSYYSFLRGIEEENIPVFNDEQIEFIKYASSLLPLVRKHEYIVLKLLLDTGASFDDLKQNLSKEIENCSIEEIEHTLKFIVKKSAVKIIDDKYYLNVKMDDQLKEYLEDLLQYGVNQYDVAYGNSEKFLLWHDYRMDQVQLKMLKDPDHNQKGTSFY